MPKKILEKHFSVPIRCFEHVLLPSSSPQILLSFRRSSCVSEITGTRKCVAAVYTLGRRMVLCARITSTHRLAEHINWCVIKFVGRYSQTHMDECRLRRYV